MSIHIGNSNKIKGSIISSNNENGGSVIGDQNEIQKSVIGDNKTGSEKQKKTWVEKHPIIVGIIIAVVAGVILKFAFWDEIVSLIG